MSSLLSPISKPTLGFTIIEVMIVLAIGGALGVIGLLALTSRLNSTNLTIATNNFIDDIQQSITDSLGSYLNGYNTFYCNGNNTPVTFSSVAPPPGTPNLGCIFLGSVIQFSPLNEPSQFINYPIAGNQINASQQEVLSLAATQADPVPIFGTVNLSHSHNIGDAITISSIMADGNSTSGIAFLLGDLNHNLSTLDSQNNLNSGGQLLNLYYVNASARPAPTVPNEAPATFASQINSADLIPANTVQICLYEDSQKSVQVTISGSGNLTVRSQIIDGSTC